MQKLVSVYLDVMGYEGRGGIRFSNADINGRVLEHLTDELSDGWRIAHLSTLEGPETGGWIIAALEKPDVPR